MAPTRIVFFVLGLGFVGAASAQDDAGVAAGEQVYNTWCVHCHDDNRPWSGGGTQALQVKYQGELPADLRERTDMSAELITAYVRDGLYRMPPFRLTEISEEDMRALAAYLTRNNPE